MKGSIGVGTGTIIYTRRKRKKKHTGPVRSNCRKCIHGVVNQDNVASCKVTGEIAVSKRYCSFYKKNKVVISE